MAKLKKAIFGPLSGKLGAIVGATWMGIPYIRQALHSDPMAGYIDQSIWLLVLFSMICFMLVTGLCWWLLQRFWLSLGLPALGDMIEQFNSLVLWQKLVFSENCSVAVSMVGCYADWVGGI
ncbi:hypothetical protein HDC92_003345 [Pedobacter sp. AK017]|uniref:hypothetical protein n=1 Tax=Pedobacter sp. AK017 TaxID=2723073 RepID=UPI00160CF7A1|nr:hypothetical protein [Pedobacter sp. AK017]MBB5439649.1 hypothetical protein [Pedobacter sp. AK017]